jgi:hypothetical protein
MAYYWRQLVNDKCLLQEKGSSLEAFRTGRLPFITSILSNQREFNGSGFKIMVDWRRFKLLIFLMVLSSTGCYKEERMKKKRKHNMIDFCESFV